MASKELDLIRGTIVQSYPYNEAKPTAPAKVIIETEEGETAEVAFFNAYSDWDNKILASPPRLGAVWTQLDPPNCIGRRVQITAVTDGEYQGRSRFKSAKGIRFLDDAPATPASAAPTAKGAPPTPTRLDPTRDSIERQVAAKGATDIGCAVRNNGQHFFVADWDAWFDHIIARIQNTPAPVDVLFDEEVEAPVKDDDSSPGDAVLGTV